MTATVDLRPQSLNINLYGEDPWSVQLTMTGLGSLEGATITARVRPTRTADSIDLTATPLDLAEGVFAIGHEEPVAGSWDLEITLPGSLPRTYLRGAISVSRDQA